MTVPGNPYDGDTLHRQLEQAEILPGVKIQEVLVVLGYRGRDSENPGRNIVYRGKPRRLDAKPAELAAAMSEHCAGHWQPKIGPRLGTVLF